MTFVVYENGENVIYFKRSQSKLFDQRGAPPFEVVRQRGTATVNFRGPNAHWSVVATFCKEEDADEYLRLKLRFAQTENLAAELHEWRTGKRRVFWVAHFDDDARQKYFTRTEARKKARYMRKTYRESYKVLRVTVRPKDKP